jgi:hypothetical protein
METTHGSSVSLGALLPVLEKLARRGTLRVTIQRDPHTCAMTKLRLSIPGRTGIRCRTIAIQGEQPSQNPGPATA